MIKIMKLLPALLCMVCLLSACKTEVATPTNNDLPQTQSKEDIGCTINYLTSTYKTLTPNTSVVAAIKGGRLDTRVKTFSYKVNNTNNTSRTYIKITGFDSGCSCYSPEDNANGCKRMIIKDKAGNEILNTMCQPVDKFVKIPGTQFSVTLNVPCWIGGSSKVSIEALDW